MTPSFRRVVLSLALLYASQAFALKEFYSLSRSVRALGKGNAHYSLSDDESALFYNPAGLGLYTGSTQIVPLSVSAFASSDALGATSTLSDLGNSSDNVDDVVDQLVALEGKMLSAGATAFSYFLTHGFAVGLLVGDAKGQVALLGSGIDAHLDSTVLVDSGLFVGKSFTFGKNFHVGINGKFLIRAGGYRPFSPMDIALSTTTNVDELQGVGGGVDFDFGMAWEIPDLVGEAMGFSLSVNNILATSYSLFHSRGGAPGLSRMGSVGTYVILKGGRTFDAVLIQLEVAEINLGGQGNPHLGARTGRLGKLLRWGVEVPIRNWLFLRTGFYQGLVTGGIGIHLPFMKLELATYGEELGNDVGRLSTRRFVLQLALGYMGNSDSPYVRRR